MRGRIVVMVMLGLGVALALVARRHRMPRPGHILPQPGPLLLVVADGLPKDAFASTEAPFLRELAGESLVFSDATAVSNVPALSLRSLLSGRRASRIELGPDTAVYQESDSLGEVLGAHGYRTQAYLAAGVVDGPPLEGFPPITVWPENSPAAPVLDVSLLVQERWLVVVHWTRPETDSDAAWVREVDGRLQSFLAPLHQSDAWDQTAVVVTSTLGVRDAGADTATTLDPGLVAVPLLLRLPRPRSRDRSQEVLDRPASLLDVPSTLLELVRAPPLVTGEGTSLLEVESGVPRKLLVEGRADSAQVGWHALYLRVGPLEYWADVESGEERAVRPETDPGRATNLLEEEAQLGADFREYLREFFQLEVDWGLRLEWTDHGAGSLGIVGRDERIPISNAGGQFVSFLRNSIVELFVEEASTSWEIVQGDGLVASSEETVRVTRRGLTGKRLGPVIPPETVRVSLGGRVRVSQ